MNDRWSVYIVIGLLGLHSLLGLGGVLYLLAVKVDANAVAVVAGLAGMGVGALASMLNVTRNTPPEPTQVEVTNTAEQPVPVEDA